MIEEIARILNRCNSKNTSINPTILYNEGWMSRLLVELSIESKIHFNGIDFGKINQWYSEGLLSSPFLARTRKDKLAEGFTHADIILGDFEVNVEKRGDVSIKGNEGIFGVIEAKMGSKLSPGTKNAPNYNQASRNLACVAFNARETSHEIFFTVVAPEIKIEVNGIGHQVDLPLMLSQISNRFDSYAEDSSVYALKDEVIERAKSSFCSVVSYESWLDVFSSHSAYRALVEFKDKCYQFNRIK